MAIQIFCALVGFLLGVKIFLWSLTLVFPQGLKGAFGMLMLVIFGSWGAAASYQLTGMALERLECEQKCE